MAFSYRRPSRASAPKYFTVSKLSSESTACATAPVSRSFIRVRSALRQSVTVRVNQI